MNSNRLLRAIVTGLTLLAVLWILHMLGMWRSVNPEATAAKSEAKAANLKSQEAQKPKSQEEITPPDPRRPEADAQGAEGNEISAFPFVAMDDCCMDGVEMDLSGCTRMLSGGRAREYGLHARSGQSLRISVEPMYGEFDVSFALMKDDHCLVGRDAAGKGQTERATVTHLSVGDYRLLVGGYDGDCGPYLLTVDDQSPSLACIQEAAAYAGRNGTVLRWKSFGEVDVSQYQVYRVTGETRERIAVLRAHGTPAGFSNYRFMDRGRLPGSGYELEMVARDGRSEKVGIAL